MRFLVFLTMCVAFVWGSVDINNASTQELQTLKGIGAKKAEAIVTYRKSHCFKKIEELDAVKGISKKIIEKNRSSITVGKCKR